MKRAIIFTNGEMKDAETIRQEINRRDLLIAADGGLRYLRKFNLLPHVLIGDLDSVFKVDIDQCKKAGVTILQYPTDKDQTDLELALDFAIKEGVGKVLIVAALGGRLDQTLGNLCLLRRSDLEGREVFLDDGIDRVFMVRKRAIIIGKMGDGVSLIPIWEDVFGITTRGLLYPLNNETLHLNQARGISNELIAGHAEILVKKGCLLCIHSRHMGKEKK